MSKLSTQVLNDYTKTLKTRVNKTMHRAKETVRKTVTPLFKGMKQWFQCDAYTILKQQYTRLNASLMKVNLPKFPLERIDGFVNNQLESIKKTVPQCKRGLNWLGQEVYPSLKSGSAILKTHTFTLIGKSTNFLGDYIALKCKRCCFWVQQKALPSIKQGATNLKDHSVNVVKKPVEIWQKRISQIIDKSNSETMHITQEPLGMVNQAVLNMPDTTRLSKFSDFMKDIISQTKRGWQSFQQNFLPKLNKGISLFFEYAKLFFLNLIVQKRNLVEFIKVIYRYYPKISFMKIDLTLLLSYLFNSPYKISKKFLIEREENDIYAYGETPLTALDKISKYARLTDRDVVMELGCGRGRTCFWLRSFIGCKVIGVDYIGSFIEKANKIKSDFGLDGIDFVCEDMFNTDLSKATVIYLYGTCMDDDSIEKLTKKIEKLPSGTKIITVSYPLTDYTQKQYLELMNVFPVELTWGTADVYIHYRK